MKPQDIALLLTGDELMSGDTVDSNSAMIAQSLAAFGHTVTEKITLGDDRARLVSASRASFPNLTPILKRRTIFFTFMPSHLDGINRLFGTG